MAEYINNAPNAPQAIGPYSQAVKANGLIFLSGQIPLDPKSGQVVGTGIVEQTTQVLKNIEAVLRHANLSFENVVKSTIFLTDLAHFKTVNELYEQALGSLKPARSTVQVAALPRGVMVEIEMIASC